MTIFLTYEYMHFITFILSHFFTSLMISFFIRSFSITQAPFLP
nr:MAG TPA: hypothetical protein [Caudoviricetes sp.]